MHNDEFSTQHRSADIMDRDVHTACPYSGQGGVYVVNHDGTRTLMERTLEPWEAPASIDASNPSTDASSPSDDERKPRAKAKIKHASLPSPSKDS